MRLLFVLDSSLTASISIHAPAKGATELIKVLDAWWYDFNPRTREGCDGLIDARLRFLMSFQSTHPRRVRPIGLQAKCYQLSISIHAPAKGATRFICWVSKKWKEFQSTHPRRVRPLWEWRLITRKLISIHAPAKGATTFAESTEKTILRFQSTHPRRVRLPKKLLTVGIS